jgi:hypothetical protein
MVNIFKRKCKITVFFYIKGHLFGMNMHIVRVLHFIFIILDYAGVELVELA